MSQYAYKINNGRVVDGIITDGVTTNAQWAIDNIGGFWVDSLELARIGGFWTEQDGFLPPRPSADCWWENGAWVCPEPPIDNNVKV